MVYIHVYIIYIYKHYYMYVWYQLVHESVPVVLLVLHSIVMYIPNSVCALYVCTQYCVLINWCVRVNRYIIRDESMCERDWYMYVCVCRECPKKNIVCKLKKFLDPLSGSLFVWEK